jgi:hypothetical protein
MREKGLPMNGLIKTEEWNNSTYFISATTHNVKMFYM